MNVERTVTFSLPKNVDDFLEAYAKLLRYKSTEEFMKEEIQWHFDSDSVCERFEVYFDENVMKQIEKRYGLVGAKAKV